LVPEAGRAHKPITTDKVTQMLHREQKPGRPAGGMLLRLMYLFDGRQRRRRRVEMDLLSLSPYLQRDIGYPW